MAHLARRHAGDILEPQRAQDEQERENTESARDVGSFHFANILLSSAKALNSSALPLGSRTKNVACSPTSPSKRISGSMMKRVCASFSRAASARHSLMSRIAPK